MVADATIQIRQSCNYLLFFLYIKYILYILIYILGQNTNNNLHDEKQHQMIWFYLYQFQDQQGIFEVAPIHLLDFHHLIDSVKLFQLLIYHHHLNQ